MKKNQNNRRSLVKPAKNSKKAASLAVSTCPTAEETQGSNPGPAEKSNFLIVSVGGGLGSVNAFTQLLARLPSNPGISFLFMSTSDHLPKHNLLNFLANASVLPVVEVKQKTRLETNRIYIPGANRVLVLSGGAEFVESQPIPKNNGNLFLDPMFRSVAEQAKVRAVGVLLSGQGTDGLLGLTQIKAEGGITFIQDPGTAAHRDLPSKALTTGTSDSALGPRQIAEELLRMAELNVLSIVGEDGAPPVEADQVRYRKIFNLLRALTAVDFSNYKPSTLYRRIHRRMILNRVTKLDDYVRVLQQNPAEVDRLFHDILINVTSFFRDAAVFHALKKKIFPKILKDKEKQAPVRIWVPGCSTGEEVYSLAITFLELIGPANHHPNIQIFATDISETALNKARLGLYPESIAADISAERLKQFFVKTDNGYQISKYVRDFCVFARQNLFEDPPFSKLDLISCRNVLIYLGPMLQKKIIPIFHYALKPEGYLLLGGSETIGLFNSLFSLVDKRSKIFQKVLITPRPEVEFSTRPKTGDIPIVAPPPKSRLDEPPSASDVSRHVDRILLSQYAPSGVVVNSALEVVQFRGQTGPFLEHAPGQASLNLLKLAKGGLVIELRTLLSRALKKETVTRKNRVIFHDGKEQRALNLEIIPFKNPPSKELYLLVLFHERPAYPDAHTTIEHPVKKKTEMASWERENLRLREELLSTKESLQAIIEEEEATNEELKSANEEIQSSNEELQSTNEELETAKEELQSTNEELTTLNEELQTRNSELSQANNDLSNLLASVNLPILMLGNDLTIRRFTPLAERFFNLIPTDVGRKISDINPNITLADMDKRVREVVDTLTTQEHDVQDRDGRWYSLRIRPYRTTENRIDGAVLMLVDINEIKRGLEELIQLVKQPVLILGGDFRIHRANEGFFQTFNLSAKETENVRIYDLGKGQWNIPALRALLEGVLPERRRVDDYPIEHEFPQVGRKTLNFSGRVLQHETKGTQLVLLGMNELLPR